MIFVMNLRRKIILIILILLAYIPVLTWMINRWFEENSYYSHGALIPLVSLFLIYEKKGKLNKIIRTSSPWGLRIFILGIFIYWLSALLNVYFLGAFSMLFIITGLILYFYGLEFLRALIFPISFLIFMIPLPLIFISFISFNLKIIAAQFAAHILNFLNIKAVIHASLIQLPHSEVIVENACGGLKSLISLTALGALFAYQMKLKFSKKIILFLSAIPIAGLTNTIRIVFLALVGEFYGTEYAQPEHLLHSLSGFAVFVLAFLMMLALERLLK